MSIYYQTHSHGFKTVEDKRDIPSDATVIWFDLNEPTEQENKFY